MAERFTERLRRRVEPIWEAQHQHPFVRGLGAGTLDLERFQVLGRGLRRHMGGVNRRNHAGFVGKSRPSRPCPRTWNGARY